MAGLKPEAKSAKGATIKELVNVFLTSKQDLLNAGELTEWTFKEYHGTCARLVKAFGLSRPVGNLVAGDFRQLRAQIAQRWGLIRLSNEIGRVRSVFKYGYESGMFDNPVRFGPDFRKPSAKVGVFLVCRSYAVRS